MTGLTRTAYLTRKFIKFSIIGMVLFVGLKFSLGFISTYREKTTPKPPPPPEIGFGKLPKIKFPAPDPNLPALTYQLQTIEGVFPSLPSQGRVYFVPQPGQPSFFFFIDRARDQAKKLGFTGEPIQLSQTAFRFSSQTDPPTILDLDLGSASFNISYPYLNDATLTESPNVPQIPQTIAEAKSFLANAGVLTDEVSNGRSKGTFMRIEGQNLAPAISFSEAQFVRVDLFRQDLENWPILPKDPEKSPINFLFSGSNDPKKRLVEVNFAYNPAERQTSSTYLLKTAARAWQDLQAGQGFVARLGQNQNGTITVRKVYLAYFDPAEPQKFLQPIFVFEGDRNFVAYVAAVDPQFTD